MTKIIYIYKYIIIALCVTHISFAQKSDIQLANEYLLHGEKEKAFSIYQDLSKSPHNISLIHKNYVNLLMDLKKEKDGERYFRFLKKNFPNEYLMDEGYFFVKLGQEEKGNELLEKQYEQIKQNYGLVMVAVRDLQDKGLYKMAEKYVLDTRKFMNSEMVLVLELAAIYKRSGQLDKMAREYVNYYLANSQKDYESSQKMLQNIADDEKEMNAIENEVFRRYQKEPDSEAIADLIVWINLQQKRFDQAFTYAKAADKRFKNNELTTLVGDVSLNNQQYNVAEKAFRSVISNANTKAFLIHAQLGLIDAKEQKLERSFPVNVDTVRALLSDYQKFIAENRNHPETKNAIVSRSLLFTYTQQPDSAIHLLGNLLKTLNTNTELKAKAKLAYANAYLQKNEPWETALILAQIEREFADTPQAYEAKLLNARTSLFTGNYKLALEHLNILKKATSREISNDAIQLSMVVQENLQTDSAGKSLIDYGKISLLLHQKKQDSALFYLKKWEEDNKNYKTLPLYGDMCWLKAIAFQQRGEFEKSISCLDSIMTSKDELLKEDALFKKAEIQEKYQNQTEKAIATYQKLILDFPKSIYCERARKRIAELKNQMP